MKYFVILDKISSQSAKILMYSLNMFISDELSANRATTSEAIRRSPSIRLQYEESANLDTKVGILSDKRPWAFRTIVLDYAVGLEKAAS